MLLEFTQTHRNLGSPEDGLPFSSGWTISGVLAIVLLNLGWSGFTWSDGIPEVFLKESSLVLGGLGYIPWVFLKASVSLWGILDATGVVLLLVSALVKVWLPGVLLQLVVLVCERLGWILGTVFSASGLVCGVLPLEAFWKVSVFVLGRCSRTSGILFLVTREADVGVMVAGLRTIVWRKTQVNT